jgi:hypothetical protein
MLGLLPNFMLEHFESEGSTYCHARGTLYC